MDHFTLGQHDAAIRSLLSDMAYVKGAIGRIEEYISERRGERRALLWTATSLGSVAGFVAGMVVQWVTR